MKCSANEVTTLAAKAARGAGAPPAQAVGFGAAALCHLIARRDPAVLRAALDALPEGAILDLPLALAMTIEDGEGAEIKGKLVVGDFPKLALSYLDAQPYTTETKLDGSTLAVTLHLTQPRARKAVARVDLPDDLAAHMQGLAAHLLVPESDASRLSGAGAGLTDND